MPYRCHGLTSSPVVQVLGILTIGFPCTFFPFWFLPWPSLVYLVPCFPTFFLSSTQVRDHYLFIVCLLSCCVFYSVCLSQPWTLTTLTLSSHLRSTEDLRCGSETHRMFAVRVILTDRRMSSAQLTGSYIRFCLFALCAEVHLSQASAVKTCVCFLKFGLKWLRSAPASVYSFMALQCIMTTGQKI